MKKLFFLLLFFYTASLFSQIKFNAGFTAGLNTSQVQGDGYSGFNKLGLRIGGWTDAVLSENDFVGFQILYSQKGSKKPPYPKLGDYSVRIIRVNYIEVPVTYKRKAGNFIYEGGLTFGKVIGERYFDESGEYTPPIKFNPFELGYLLGIHYFLNAHWEGVGAFGGSVLSARDFGAYIPEIGFLNNWRRGTYHLWISFSLNYKLGN